MKKMAEGFSNDTTGKFYNHGTIGTEANGDTQINKGFYPAEFSICRFQRKKTYLAGDLAFEFKRYLKNGNYALRLGVRQAFFGVNSNLNVRYEGGGNNFTLDSNQNKFH